jgi:AmmeMemoRadiSam system protein A
VKTSEGSELRLANWAWLKGWKARLFGRGNVHRNPGASGHPNVPAEEGASSPATTGWTEEERRLLLDLARRSLQAAVNDEMLPEIEPPDVSDKLLEPTGCFVTLRNKGKLRGCLGQIFPRAALYKAVMHNARSAATSDPRFAQVRPDELAQIEIEISILAEPQPLSFDSPEELLAKLHPLADGVVLQIGDHTATFLPQVWANIPDRVAFMNSLSRKADCDEDAWRNPGVSVSVYRAESFKDST